MKKIMIGMVVGFVLVAVLGIAGYVYAQTVTPPAPQGRGSGYGMWFGRGMRAAAGADQKFEPGSGFMHDEMVAAFAEKLGMSVQDLDDRLDKGETMAQVASSKGLSADQFTTLMTEARTEALDQAVKNGKITQDQADWMKQRGPGQMGGGRGMMGRGGNANPACPYSTPAAP
jgi:hypothetical protein